MIKSIPSQIIIPLFSLSLVDSEPPMKPAPSRTRSSMMSSMGLKESSSDLDSASSSSDESKGKDELFKSLKFSDDILQQMNAKRQEIVGGHKTLGTAQEETDLIQRRGSFKKDIEKGHIEIGAPLPQTLTTKPSQQTDSINNEIRIEGSLSTHDDGCVDVEYGDSKVEKLTSNESISSEHDSDQDKDLKCESGKSKINSYIKSDRKEENSRDMSDKMKNQEQESFLAQTYQDELMAFKASLEQDMMKEKMNLMNKFNEEMAEEMRRLEDQRFEKLKNYEIEMTRKLHKELDEFKENVKKELEEKKKEIISHQEFVFDELAQNTSTLSNQPNAKQAAQNGHFNVHTIGGQPIEPKKQAKNTNAKTKDDHISSKIARASDLVSDDNYSNPFSKQLEDLEKDIRKLRTHMGVGGGGSLSDYSSYSDGVDVEPIQINVNNCDVRTMSPDNESITTYTDDDQLKMHRSHMKYPHRNKYVDDDVMSWSKEAREHGHRRVQHPFLAEHIISDSTQDYTYINRGKFIFTVSFL